MEQPKKRRKVGRPRLPKGEAKGRIVPVRFTNGEVQHLTRKAKADGKSLSQWLRGAALGDS